MRCYLSLLAVLLLLASPARPQTPAGPAVIQSSSHIVLVNVVAKDKHGKPIADLTRDDFVLRDNGKEQKIAFFALDDAEAGAPSNPGARAADRLTFSNRPGTRNTAVTVFLFDELNTQVTDQQLAKKDFLRYLRELPPDSRVALFVLGDSLHLAAAIESGCNRFLTNDRRLNKCTDITVELLP